MIIVGNHFNSKGGDDPLFGRFQPPVRVTETQRHQQADDRRRTSPAPCWRPTRSANLVVGGDLNDFEFSETLDILEDGGLFNLMETLPVWERYSYVFEGNSQTLDQILVSKALKSDGPEYDSVHVNAEFFDQASDHDPQVARLEVLGPAPLRRRPALRDGRTSSGAAACSPPPAALRVPRPARWRRSASTAPGRPDRPTARRAAHAAR